MGKARWHPRTDEHWLLLSAGHPIAEARRDAGSHAGRIEEEWVWALLDPPITGRAAMLCDAQSCAWRAARDNLHPGYFE